jgi:hypothetical protein
MAANALRASMVFAPVSAYRTYADIKSGKDNNIASAALDFAGSELQMAGSGALVAGNLGWKAFLAGAVAKNAVTEWAQPQRPQSVSAYAWDVGLNTVGDAVMPRGGGGPTIDNALKQLFPLTSQLSRDSIYKANLSTKIQWLQGGQATLADQIDLTGKSAQEIRQLEADQALQTQTTQSPEHP